VSWKDQKRRVSYAELLHFQPWFQSALSVFAADLVTAQAGGIRVESRRRDRAVRFTVAGGCRSSFGKGAAVGVGTVTWRRIMIVVAVVTVATFAVVAVDQVWLDPAGRPRPSVAPADTSEPAQPTCAKYRLAARSRRLATHFRETRVRRSVESIDGPACPAGHS
jgi:hypothetical protein